ncbi:bifunctional sulfate adenylyltransferase/adenylylsulfate kinase [Sediminicurvatus halobius]|uniref:Adenylyl-sulfate kinase n=1 Tax=Sediminicurvatus halobius TaxID=2182432 RepID=A0A2U2N510_9GAMM|nr:bifunctional sulfate adenylyltransferase/adenylylsulfate kinase [Spiribacter halobius]PWG64138.1 adenylyltransferase [Spiribacter halobius]UEX78740.1 bifunctional sulfate adenylyltransferase/adenylylsulfate kinase [Spiribacter halobius]
MTDLIAPHGGTLVELQLPAEEAEAEKARAAEYPSWDLTERQLCDLELLLNGGFSPLTGFLGRADYERVVQEMRLTDGTLWPIPVTLDVSEAFAGTLAPGSRVALRDPEGVVLAVLTVDELWRPDREAEAAKVFGTTDGAHPGVAHLRERSHPVYVGGRVAGLAEPVHYDFTHLRLSPRHLRERFARSGWRRVVAFQTRNPMHRAHVELTFRAARQAEANLLIHPVVGMTKPGDVDHFSRVRCYEHVLKKYPEQTTALSLLPLAMRMAGPREALWHAIIRRNHGCTHFIVGRDHAGPGKGSNGEDFYGPYDAQELVRRHADELGIEMVPFQMMVYVKERAEYAPIDEVDESRETVMQISGTEFRRRMREGLEIPDWFGYPEVVEELRKTYPPRARQGLTLFFTGLSGSGKSTLANAVMVKLMEIGGRRVTLLDGDIVRKHLSSELGFSKEHRDLNIRRIGFVAAEITKNGGVAICAPIAPYAATRRDVRAMVEETGGGFIEIHVSTPLEECERRDRKGLYAKARAGLIKGFTGIDDPYEAPETPELAIDTTDCSPDEAAQQVILKLERLGFIDLR